MMEKKELKIVTYNVKALHWDPENPRGAIDRREDVAAVIRELDGDIVGVQEIDHYLKRTGYCNQTKYLAEACGYPYYFFTPTCDGGRYGHCILSKYPIIEKESFYYKEQSGEVRRYGRVAIDVEGKKVVFYNTHLCLDYELIKKQFEEVLDRAAAEDCPSFVTADYNLYAPDRREIAKTKDVVDLAGEVDVGTFHNGAPIDDIYIHNIEDYYWDEEKGHGLIVGDSDASDHFPVHTFVKI